MFCVAFATKNREKPLVRGGLCVLKKAKAHRRIGKPIQPCAFFLLYQARKGRTFLCKIAVSGLIVCVFLLSTICFTCLFYHIFYPKSSVSRTFAENCAFGRLGRFFYLPGCKKYFQQKSEKLLQYEEICGIMFSVVRRHSSDG